MTPAFPPFPLLLEIPSGFPHSHRFDYGFDWQLCGIYAGVRFGRHFKCKRQVVPKLREERL